MSDAIAGFYEHHPKMPLPKSEPDAAFRQFFNRLNFLRHAVNYCDASYDWRSHEPSMAAFPDLSNGFY